MVELPLCRWRTAVAELPATWNFCKSPVLGMQAVQDAHCRECLVPDLEAAPEHLLAPATNQSVAPALALCRHLGEQTGERECESCGGKTRLKVFTCRAGHGDVTLLDCVRCQDYSPAASAEAGK